MSYENGSDLFGNGMLSWVQWYQYYAAQMRKNDRQIDAKFDRENVFKVRPGKIAKIGQKCCKVWPKSSAENCKRKQMQSISAMNSQSSINWVQLRNSNLNVDWDHVYTLVDREASTFWWEASVDRLGPFTVNDLNLTKLAQICIEKKTFRSKIFTQASKTNDSLTRASKTNDFLRKRASKTNDFSREQTNDRALS